MLNDELWWESTGDPIEDALIIIREQTCDVPCTHRHCALGALVRLALRPLKEPANAQ